MIRLGIPADLTQLDTFDIFAGDRDREIFEQRLRVYLSDEVYFYCDRQF